MLMRCDFGEPAAERVDRIASSTDAKLQTSHPPEATRRNHKLQNPTRSALPLLKTNPTSATRVLIRGTAGYRVTGSFRSMEETLANIGKESSKALVGCADGTRRSWL